MSPSKAFTALTYVATAGLLGWMGFECTENLQQMTRKQSYAEAVALEANNARDLLAAQRMYNGFELTRDIALGSVGLAGGMVGSLAALGVIAGTVPPIRLRRRQPAAPAVA